MSWLQHLRPWLELLYFVSGIAVAIVAIFGLKQLKIGLSQIAITKEVARTNARRESVKYAADQCRYFAEEVVPNQRVVGTEYQRLHLTFLNCPAPKPHFVINQGEIMLRSYSTALLDQQWDQISFQTIGLLNATESFAIPFAEGVADDDIGYRETARAFCQMVEVFLPALFQLRRLGEARYESTIKLYTMWSKRLTAENVAEPANNRINPILPNFDE